MLVCAIWEWIEGGSSLVSVSDIIVTLGIGRGKWTPDFALLAVGPVTRMLEIMAKSYKIDYDLGIEDEHTFETAVVYKKKSELLEEALEEISEEVEETRRRRSTRIYVGCRFRR